MCCGGHLGTVPRVLEDELRGQARLLLAINRLILLNCRCWRSWSDLTRALQVPHRYQLVLPAAGKNPCVRASPAEVFVSYWQLTEGLAGDTGAGSIEDIGQIGRRSGKALFRSLPFL